MRRAPWGAPPAADPPPSTPQPAPSPQPLPAPFCPAVTPSVTPRSLRTPSSVSGFLQHVTSDTRHASPLHEVSPSLVPRRTHAGVAGHLCPLRSDVSPGPGTQRAPRTLVGRAKATTTRQRSNREPVPPGDGKHLCTPDTEDDRRGLGLCPRSPLFCPESPSPFTIQTAGKLPAPAECVLVRPVPMSQPQKLMEARGLCCPRPSRCQSPLSFVNNVPRSRPLRCPSGRRGSCFYKASTLAASQRLQVERPCPRSRHAVDAQPGHERCSQPW